MEAHRSIKGHKDFRYLWLARVFSQLGSAVGMVALPIIAVTVVEASTFEVALISVCAAIATAALAFPLGHFVEFRRKRPIMIALSAAVLIPFALHPPAGRSKSPGDNGRQNSTRVDTKA